MGVPEEGPRVFPMNKGGFQGSEGPERRFQPYIEMLQPLEGISPQL